MALITCPECGKQISDCALSCPNCGFPLANLNRVQEEPRDDLTDSKNLTSDPIQVGAPHAASISEEPVKSNKNLIISAGVLIAVLAMFAFLMFKPQKITAQNVKISQLYNTSLGFGIELGMSKSSVDEVLGTPEASYNEYLYADQYLYAQYGDGKLVSIYTDFPTGCWVTSGGVTPGIDLDVVRKVLGEPKSIEHDDQWWYYGGNGIVTGIKVFHDTVDGIYIYDANWKFSQNS